MSRIDLKDLIILARQVEWRYKLDTFEDAALEEILAAVNQARIDTVARLTKQSYVKMFDGVDITFDKRTKALLDELNDLSIGIRQQLKEDIAEVAGIAGMESYPVQNDILSFGGRAAGFSTVSLTAAQIKSMVTDVPVGGHILSDWVDRTFDTRLKQELKRDIQAGMLKGSNYQTLVRRVGQKFGTIREDTISLVRTYVQDINVTASENVYKANDDLIKGLKWSAVLEPGYSNTGRGTCLRCAALDGEIFKINENHPPIPLHSRCRCTLLPVTKTWRELGLDIDEIKKAYRPYTIRENKNIDAGGRRDILEHGFHGGDYASWWAKQSKEFKTNAVGPGRMELLESGKIKFDDLVDRKTGRQRTIAELTNG